MYAKFSSLLALTACLALTHAAAQDLKQIPPPTAPFVASVPENADWTITLQYPSAAGAAPAAPTPPGGPPHVDRHPSQVHSTKTGKYKRELITYVDGSVDEHWYIGSLYFWTPPNEEVSVYNFNNSPAGSESGANAMPFGPSSAFAGVGWVGLKSYDKVVVLETVPCYHYQDPAQGIEAWINVQTRMPIAYKSSDILYHYKFGAPPTETLTLPPAYDKAWKKVQLMLNIK